MAKKWRVEFDKYSGYDCMSDGFRIFDNDNKCVCVIDCADFKERVEAEIVAKLIVDAVNAFRRRRSA